MLWKCLFSKYKLSEIENYYSSISIRKIDSRRRKKKKKITKWFSQVLVDKFQMEFPYTLDHANGKIRRSNCREEWNLARLILEFSQNARESVFQRLQSW